MFGNGKVETDRNPADIKSPAPCGSGPSSKGLPPVPFQLRPLSTCVVVTF